MPDVSWILVAGTGVEALSPELKAAAEALGRALAAAGFGLVTCGWPGVDEVVGAAFSEASRASGPALTSRFKQFYQRGRRPSVDGGQWIEVGQDAAEYLSAVEAADAVVLLGGRGGTYIVYEHARLARKLVLPLPTTEGEARRVYDDIGRRFDRAVSLISAAEFAELDRAPGDAIAVVVRLLRQHLKKKAIRDGAYLDDEAILGRENESAFARLAEDIQQTQMLAFIGAGVSIPGGYPDWNTLIERMRQALPGEVERGIAWVSREDDLLMRAQYYRQYLGEDYGPFISAQFGEESGKVRDLHLDLVRLPVAHVLTTNYDNLLERAHAQAGLAGAARPTDWKNPSEVEALLRAARRRGEQRRYVHLHGVFSDPANIVLTESDYQDHYHRTTASEALLAALFTAHAFLFVGFSFGDLDVMGVFRNTMARIRVAGPLHYAFMALDPRTHDPTLVRQRLRQKFKIDPVFYLHTPDHAGLHRLVVRLLDKCRPT